MGSDELGGIGPTMKPRSALCPCLHRAEGTVQLEPGRAGCSTWPTQAFRRHHDRDSLGLVTRFWAHNGLACPALMSIMALSECGLCT